MRIAFLTEMNFKGKVPDTHTNMRTEFAWMHTLDADHYHIRSYEGVVNYDHVFIIFPKGMVYLNAIAVKMSEDRNPVSDLLDSNLINCLKSNNGKVHFVQEGPHWLWNDYEMIDQINFYNLLVQCDSIFCHNEYDRTYYLGFFPEKRVNVIPSLMIETLLKPIVPKAENKAIIGGNFARWYGGFESYTIASIFETPIWVQDSHAKRYQEPMMENLFHLNRVVWIDWMRTLSSFKYAVHLMPTVAAGTFSLNCAYFGIPCIGNEKVDTQRLCHPELSVDVADLNKARTLAKQLKEDEDFYHECSKTAKENYERYYSVKIWNETLTKALQ